MTGIANRVGGGCSRHCVSFPLGFVSDADRLGTAGVADAACGTQRAPLSPSVCPDPTPRTLCGPSGRPSRPRRSFPAPSLPHRRCVGFCTGAAPSWSGVLWAFLTASSQPRRLTVEGSSLCFSHVVTPDYLTGFF